MKQLKERGEDRRGKREGKKQQPGRVRGEEKRKEGKSK